MDFMAILQGAFSSALGPDAIVYALAAIGLNVHFGYTGLLNFGQAGFMAVGAYGVAASVATWGLPLWVGVINGFLASIVLAIILGVPTLRLRADYLAIATIAAAEIIRRLFGSLTLSEWFGGSVGLNGYAGGFFDLNPFTGPVDFFVINLSARDAWVTTVGWTLVAISLLIVWASMRSPWGRVLKSIREDEDAVRALGKNVYSYKMQSLILGGLFGTLGGVVLALKQSVIPTDYTTAITFFAYTALLLGGAGRVFGPVIGSIIFWFLLTFLGGFFSQAAATGLFPEWFMTEIQASVVRFVLVGLGLMLLMIFRPQGIFGDRREIAIDGR